MCDDSDSKKTKTHITVDWELHESDLVLPINKMLSNRILNMSVESLWESQSYDNEEFNEAKEFEELWDKYSSMSYSDMRIMAEDLTHQVERVFLLHKDNVDDIAKLQIIANRLYLRIRVLTALMVQIQTTGFPTPKSTELRARLPPFSLSRLKRFLTDLQFDNLLIKAAKVDMWDNLIQQGLTKKEANKKVAAAFNTTSSSIEKLMLSVSSKKHEDPQ